MPKKRGYAPRKGSRKGNRAVSRAPIRRAAPRVTRVALRASKPSEAMPAFVTIRCQSGSLFSLQANPRFQHMVSYWAYAVRNRIRWSTDETASNAMGRQSRADLLDMGLSEAALSEIAGSGVIEIVIPFKSEVDSWEARLFPWEFVISSATRSARGSRSLAVIRQLSLPASTPIVARGPTKVMVVTSLPGDLVNSGYNFNSEVRLVESNLGLHGGSQRISNPTLAELTAKIARSRPDIVHLAGLDMHQGMQLLGLKEDRSFAEMDGYYLAADDGTAIPVMAAALANAFGGAKSHQPRLVSCNFYNSSARTAALLVGSGGASAAIGFQDEVDDALAERFFANFYSAWRDLRWDLVRAFRVALRATDGEEGKTGTGVVLWSAQPLLEKGRRESIKRDEERVSTKRKTRAARIGDPRRDLDVVIEPQKTINYSLLHNNQNLFTAFSLRNNSSHQAGMKDIRIRVELCVGDQTYPFRTMLDLDTTVPKSMAEMIKIPLTSSFFRSLRESVRTVLFVKVSCMGKDVREETYAVKLLAVDEWLDDPNLNAFLPSFVLPRDPAVLRVVDAAQRYLMSLTDNSAAGFDGYQGVDPAVEDPSRSVDLQAWAIWSALSYDLPLSYINPPPTFTDHSQRLRSPSDVIDGHRGTCIDLALLLAACLEYSGLYPA
jgi:hypothetical protein